MTYSAIPAFESTVQKSNEWIRELADELRWDERQRAYHGLRAVLHALRDRLTVEEASDLSSQLPMLLRGMYYENWQPSRTPVHDRTREQFLQHIFDEFPEDFGVDPKELAQAVFRLLQRHVSEGEIDDVKALLPPEIRDLWP